MKSVSKKIISLAALFALLFNFVMPQNLFAIVYSGEDHESSIPSSSNSYDAKEYLFQKMEKGEYNFSATDTNDFYFKDFTADYYLYLDEKGESVLKVEEDLTAVFPDFARNHGITRTIPTTNQKGKNKTVLSEKALHFSANRNIAKTEENYSNITYTIGDKYSYVTGEQKYHFEYEFHNVITEYKDKLDVSGQGIPDIDQQEIYWDTNGTGWSQPFLKLKATVHLDDTFKNGLLDTEPSCYTGSYGATKSVPCTVTKNEDGFTFEAEHLYKRENLTFDIAFKPDTAKVTIQKDYSILIFCIVIISIFCIVLCFVVKRYNKYTKSKAKILKETFVTPQYQPDPELSVEQAAEITLSAHKRKTATLLELAVQKKIQIYQEEKNGILSKKKIWHIRILTTKGLNSAQESLLKLLAGGYDISEGKDITIERQKYSSSLSLLDSNYTSSTKIILKAKGLYEKSPYASVKKESKLENEVKTTFQKPFYSAIAAIGILILIFGAPLAFSGFMFWLIDSLEKISEVDTGMVYDSAKYVGAEILIPLLGFTFIIVTPIICYLIIQNQKFKNITVEGIKKDRYFEGLKLYIKMAEKDRIAFNQSVGAATDAQGICKIYEKLLPYACIFGLESSWSNTLEKYYELEGVEDPDWFTGYSGNLALGSMLSSMNSSVSSSISSATTDPSSSSSSGFSGGGGGGFSGGGGGGGGGGGW